MNLILNRITNSFLTFPTLHNWFQAALILVLYTLIAIPLGLKFRFLQLEILSPWQTALKTTTIAFFMPAFLEEIFWRVLLVPHPIENIALPVNCFWIGLSLLLFIAYHPLNLCVRHNTFKKPVFLVLAALLGIVCTIAYLQSGSLLCPTIVHWLIVVVWLLFLGGYRRVQG